MGLANATEGIAESPPDQLGARDAVSERTATDVDHTGSSKCRRMGAMGRSHRERELGHDRDPGPAHGWPARDREGRYRLQAGLLKQSAWDWKMFVRPSMDFRKASRFALSAAPSSVSIVWPATR